MQVRAARFSLFSAGLAVVAAAAVAGCSASTGTGTGGSSAAPVSPLAAVKLAAKTTGTVNSFTATMNIQLTAKPGAGSTPGLLGDTRMTMTLAEQLHPALLVSVNIGSLSTGGAPIPAGLSEIVTPTMVYLKWSYLTQQMHLAKPWLAVPLSTYNKMGINLSQMLDQATSNGPLADSQLLAGATSVHRVGTGSVNGVPVTEYIATIPLSAALSHLTGSTKTMAEQMMASLGITSETLTVWVDGNNVLRKVATTAAGTGLTETAVMTVTSINQPASIAVPPAGQTSSLPGGALG